MGNKASNPSESFEEALRRFTKEELETMQAQFESMCHANQTTLRLENMAKHAELPVLRKRVLPRLFEVMDIKKENEISFESYISTLSMLRRNKNEDVSKFLLLLYANPKSKIIRRENLYDLIYDANTTYSVSDCSSFEEIQKRSENLKDLLFGLVDIVLSKYSQSKDKLTFPEFCDFVREDENIQRFVRLLPTCLGQNWNI